MTFHCRSLPPLLSLSFLLPSLKKSSSIVLPGGRVPLEAAGPVCWVPRDPPAGDDPMFASRTMHRHSRHLPAPSPLLSPLLSPPPLPIFFLPLSSHLPQHSSRSTVVICWLRVTMLRRATHGETLFCQRLMPGLAFLPPFCQRLMPSPVVLQSMRLVLRVLEEWLFSEPAPHDATALGYDL